VCSVLRAAVAADPAAAAREGKLSVALLAASEGVGGLDDESLSYLRCVGNYPKEGKLSVALLAASEGVGGLDDESLSYLRCVGNYPKEGKLSVALLAASEGVGGLDDESLSYLRWRSFQTPAKRNPLTWHWSVV
jgi:O-acetyl-ADP-ribose deacetylase (regulator of RNase III)